MQNQDDSAINTSSVENTSSNLTVSRVEKVETPKKPEKKDEIEDPKPRIVLTFRSEKSGAKSSNMKIVTPEEKQEEVSPRRSSRTRHSKQESFEDRESESTSRRDKSQCSQPVSENDDLSDSSSVTRRSAPRRTKEIPDVLSTANARKEKSYNEAVATPTQRLSRRIKPTAKILANEELRIGLESQNNARLGIQSDKAEEGVSTRRTGQAKSAGTTAPDKRSTKRKTPHNKETAEAKDGNLVMKLKHLCELGLKAASKSTDEDSSDENDNSEFNPDEADGEDEEIDDDTEIINKLLEADEEWYGESSDDEYLVSGENAQSQRPRRSRRKCSGYGNDSDNSMQSLPVSAEKNAKNRPRRSSRLTMSRVSYEPEHQFEIESDGEYSPKRKKTRSFQSAEPKVGADADESSAPAPGEAGEAGEEAACPADADYAAIATCYCEDPSNVYADPSDLTEPVFCQAIEMVDGVRCGCSHPARREAGAGGAGDAGGGGGAGGAGGAGDGKQLAPLLRAGPRAPYFLACRLHAAQLAKHMCCPTCGLFCTQGIFYQCSEGHLFHLECGVLSAEAKLRPGCPHCGVVPYRWVPANRDTARVQLTMHCSNERVYLPDQRVQCKPAYLGFSSTDKPQPELGPLIPEELLPSPPVDLARLCAGADDALDDCADDAPGDCADDAPGDCADDAPGDCAERLYDAIVRGDTVEQLIPKIVRVRGAWPGAGPGAGLSGALAARAGDTAAHAAAARGRPGALYTLHFAGADLDAADAAGRTPLMRAILALLDKNSPEEMEVEHNEESTKDGADVKNEPQDDQKKSGQVKDELKDGKLVEVKEEKEGEEKDKEIVEGQLGDDVEKEVDKPSDEDLMKVIRYIVAAGCDLSLPGPEGMTALHVAAAGGAARAVAALLAGGAPVDARDHGGWTPLARAGEHDHDHVVRLLLEAGADGCAADAEGNAPAHWCALAGAARALRALLTREPRAAHALNAHGDTPLHIAAREGHYSCVVILLARGARTDVENAAGELAVEVCAGRCQAAVSLNMQLALAVRDRLARRRLLDSDIARGREPFPVECVNEVDDEPAPQFTYVSRHVMPEPIAIDCSITTMQGCACADGCCAGEAGCAGGAGEPCACGALGVRRWYRAGRLPPAFPYHDPPMLFECNQTCACDLKRCTNHVVSRLEAAGSLGVRVGVFRTARRGWGLRARQPVLRGAPVALYCGELLPHAAADARDNDHYMFALDVKPDLLEQCAEKTQLCVDAARFGSAARFVNHSCRPNLAPVRVFTAARDLRLPAVALFARTNIAAGEELTFDYGDKFWAVKSKWMKCECESPNCRYPTKSTEESSS